ncbi:uncharacterized protein LOC144439070 isoform X2 [Glandiceps talaboti]
MTDNKINDCYEVFHDPGGIIKAFGDYHDGNYDCQITIQSRDPDQMYHLRFESFEVYSLTGDCSDHSLQIYDGTDRAARPLTNQPQGLCHPMYQPEKWQLPKPMYTTGDSVTLYLYRLNPPGPTRYNIIFTAFKRQYDDSCYKCLNDTGMCIDDSLKCDSLKHCTDGSDESSKGKGGCSESTGLFQGVSFVVMITIVVIVGLFIIVVFIVLCVYYFRRSSKKPKFKSNTIYKPTTSVDYGRTPQTQTVYQPTDNDYALAQTPAGYPAQGKSESRSATPLKDITYSTSTDADAEVSTPLKYQDTSTEYTDNDA